MLQLIWESQRSQALSGLVLYMRPLRQVFFVSPAELSAKIVVLSDVRRPGVIILASHGEVQVKGVVLG